MQNTVLKAGAQNYALTHIKTEYTLAIDADNTLKEDALKKLFSAMGDSDVVAACGFVISQKISTLWGRGRYVEHLMELSFYKGIQEYYEKSLISSGFVPYSAQSTCSKLTVGHCKQWQKIST